MGSRTLALTLWLVSAAAPAAAAPLLDSRESMERRPYAHADITKPCAANTPPAPVAVTQRPARSAPALPSNKETRGARTIEAREGAEKNKAPAARPPAPSAPLPRTGGGFGIAPDTLLIRRNAFL